MQFTKTAYGLEFTVGTDVCSVERYAENILRVRYAFDGEVNCRKAMQAVILPQEPSAFVAEETAEGCVMHLEDGTAVDVQEKPFAITIRDAQGRIVHRDLAGKAYLKVANLRRFHYFERMGFTAFYGLGERSGRLNKAGRHLRFISSATPHRSSPAVCFTIRLTPARLTWAASTATTGRTMAFSPATAAKLSITSFSAEASKRLSADTPA